MWRASVGIGDSCHGAHRSIRAAFGVGTLLAAVSGGAVDVTAPPALAGRLVSLSGAGARDCGVFPLRSDLAAAIACAQGAMASGRPYRLAPEERQNRVRQSL